jgi:DNA-binding winged helix-turn-helix (wHTH) protein
MDASPQPQPPAPLRLLYHFSGFTLDPARGALSQPFGKEVSLRPKATEVLRHLAEKAGRVVPRQELMQAVWGDAFVAGDRITQCVTEIRRALGAEATRLLRTLPKRGYLLAAEVTQRRDAQAKCHRRDPEPGGAVAGTGGARFNRCR